MGDKLSEKKVFVYRKVIADTIKIQMIAFLFKNFRHV